MISFSDLLENKGQQPLWKFSITPSTEFIGGYRQDACCSINIFPIKIIPIVLNICYGKMENRTLIDKT